MQDASGDTVEGRLIAHRQLLTLLVAALDRTGEGPAIRQFLEERSVLQDGQEDPGAVATGAAGVGLAIAEELRLVNERSRGSLEAV